MKKRIVLLCLVVLAVAGMARQNRLLTIAEQRIPIADKWQAAWFACLGDLPRTINDQRKFSPEISGVHFNISEPMMTADQEFCTKKTDVQFGIND